MSAPESAGPTGLDAYKPAEIARLVETAGVAKAGLGVAQTLTLAILAGAFIGFGGAAYTMVMTGADPGFGPARLLGGAVFSLGLILVIVGGAELFTGNALMTMAAVDGRITPAQLLRNWSIVYAGNAVGSVALAVAFALTGLLDGPMGATAAAIADGKGALDPAAAFMRGILCNALVCLAVWLTFSARSTTDRILAVIFPIAAFVAAGFEHSVANMYFIPVALLLEAIDPSFVAAAGVDVSALGWGAFFGKNLLPVTIGNVLGGSLFVAATYWAIFLRPRASQ